MDIIIENECFLEIERISAIQSYVYRLKSKSINDNVIYGAIEIDISYKDNDNHECFKSLSFDISLDSIEEVANDFKLINLKPYLIENQGVNIEYELEIMFDEKKEIIEYKDTNEFISNNSDENIDEEFIENNINPNQKEIEKIKENISKDYENKLAESLQQRENVIITTKASNSENDFLRFFDERLTSYFKIKTLECTSEKELNSISKEYNIPIEELIKGYDKINGKVIFKYKG